MVHFCCVVGCGNRSNREKSRKFYCLPNIHKCLARASYKADIILTRRKQWLLNIKRADLLKDGDEAYSPRYIRVCSDHFVSGKPSDWSDVDNIDWAPTLHMNYSQVLNDSVFENKHISNKKKAPRYSTRKKRELRMLQYEERKMFLNLMVSSEDFHGKGWVEEMPKEQPREEKNPGKERILKKKSGMKRKKMETKRKKNVKKEKKVVQREKTDVQREKADIQREKADIQIEKEDIRREKEDIQNIIFNQQLSECPLSYLIDSLDEEKLTENPVIHRITSDCIVSIP